MSVKSVIKLIIKDVFFCFKEEGFDEYKDRYLSGMGAPHAVYVDVTSIVCRHACVKLHSDSCCSVVYERAIKRRCLITPPLDRPLLPW